MLTLKVNISVFISAQWSEAHLVSEHVQSFSLLSAVFLILRECKVTHTELPSL